MRIRTALLALMAAGSGPLLAQQDAKPAHPPKLADLVEQARLDSNDAITHYDLGRAYIRAKRFDEAEGQLREAVQLAPQYADAYLALAQMPEARGAGYWRGRVKAIGQDSVRSVLAQAHAMYRRAFLLNPLVDLSLAAGSKSAMAGDAQLIFYVWWFKPLDDAMSAMRDQKFQKAFDDLTHLMDDPRAGTDRASVPPSALWLRGLVAAHLKNYDVAIADISLLTGRAYAAELAGHAASGSLVSNDYRYTLATFRYLAGRFDEALPTFRRALEFDVGLYQAHIQMARMFEAEKRWDDAVKERQAAVDVNPDDPSLLVDLGATLAAADRFEEAENTLGQAMAAAPRDARIPYLLGMVALRRDRKDAARQAFARFLAIAPSRFASQVAEVHEQLAAMP